tara:strand:- start:11 stop:340 length:330 start_codon:yes stop_codon:yes gene_type:complete
MRLFVGIFATGWPNLVFVSKVNTAIGVRFDRIWHVSFWHFVESFYDQIAQLIKSSLAWRNIRTDSIFIAEDNESREATKLVQGKRPAIVSLIKGVAVEAERMQFNHVWN